MDTLILILNIMDQINFLISLFNKKSYHSLGHFCLTSTLLKSLNVKHYSLPFDWIFSNNKMLHSCLSDQFKSFLTKEYYTSLPPTMSEKKRCNHKLYGDIFNHHNPTLNTDYQYFSRCVQRFHSLISSDELKVFFIISYELINIDYFITHIAPYLGQFVLIYIYLSNNKEKTEIELNYVLNNMIIYTYHFKSKCTGVKFENNEETELLLNHLKNFII